MSSIIENSENTFDVYLSVDGGTVNIGESQIRATISGQGLVAGIGDWNGRIAINDIITRIGIADVPFGYTAFNDSAEATHPWLDYHGVTQNITRIAITEVEFGYDVLNERITATEVIKTFTVDAEYPPHYDMTLVGLDENDAFVMVCDYAFVSAEEEIDHGRMQHLALDTTPYGNLVLNPTEAVTIRRIYSMFLQGMSPYGIATRLTADGIKSPGGKDKWNAGAVRSILTNEKYKGDALLQKSYTVDFLTKKKKVNEGEIPQYYVEGNHEAIISPDVFEQVQRELERRKASKGRHSGVHLFSGKIRCGQCGEWYGSKTWHSTSKYRRVVWQCNHKYDGDEKCTTAHLTEDDIKTLFVSAANKLITQKGVIITALTASLPTAIDLTSLEAERDELHSEMAVVSDLIETCIYENAQVALDQAEYQKRYDGLTARFDTAKARFEAVEDAIRSKQSRRATIEDFLATLKDANLVDNFDTGLWCGLVHFVTVHSKDDVRFTFKNGQEIKA